MSNTLQVEVRYNPSHNLYAGNKSAIFKLQNAFTEPLKENAGATLVHSGFYDIEQDLMIIEVEVDDDSFQLFQDDYDEFIDVVFGHVLYEEFGVEKVTVLDVEGLRRQFKQFFEEMEGK